MFTFQIGQIYTTQSAEEPKGQVHLTIRVRRLLTCSCQTGGAAKSSAAFGFEAATVAPELAYVTVRYVALTPFGKVADLLWELLVGGAHNAGTVRNRTMRAGEAVA